MKVIIGRIYEVIADTKELYEMAPLKNNVEVLR